MEIFYRRFVSAEAEDLIGFLAGDTWPFHGAEVVDRETVRQRINEGCYDGEDARAFWITVAGERAGLVRLMDLDDDTPLFDLRIRSRYRGRGLGGQALAWLTGYLFTEFPGVRRIEGTTRQDNAAMRRAFLRAGYAKEAHYRDAWPTSDGGVRDAVGYAILRRDWVSGSTTVPDWDDERLLARLHGAQPRVVGDGPGLGLG
ncbi:GNAT family N-acetyltransferase [Streptacidiphilus neutrinimicus]|uniref:GNAT family N-acetyltransferase n=1 Tax=Streptacidiphilus neutrinimicus TaxID=105420 RepID=UPI0005A5F9F9|nr:GNAT family protein [Streptacidiphilus neutrinimicus]